MCKPVTLHQTKKGCISWCPECDHINIAFGTVVFALTSRQFAAFRTTLNNDLTHCCAQVPRCGKILRYNTDSHNVGIVLNYVELVQLTSLMNYSALLFTAYLIIYTGNKH